MHDPRESFRPSPPVILDFDGSVLPVAEGERRIPLGSWQEAIRFGCTRRAFSALEAHLEGVLPVDCGCAFMGSGDFHHVTLIPLRRLCRRLPPCFRIGCFERSKPGGHHDQPGGPCANGPPLAPIPTVIRVKATTPTTPNATCSYPCVDT